MAERKLLGQNLNHEERILLAQLTVQPGWKVLVKLIAEACRNATEDVIKLDPTAPRYNEQVIGLQTTARAMNKFSAEVLDSVKLRVSQALKAESQSDEDVKPTTRFKGFVAPTKPVVQSPTEGAEVESN